MSAQSLALEGVNRRELYMRAGCDDICAETTSTNVVAIVHSGELVVVEEVDLPVAVTEGDGVVDEPRVVQVLVDLGSVTSVLGVHGQHLVEELEEARGEVLPHARWLGGHARLPLHELVIVGVAERGLLPGETAGQHAEEEDAHRPHVAGGIHEEPRLVRGVADLGRGVRDAAAHAGNVRAGAQGHAEVDDLHVRALLVSEDDVLGLDVSVHELLAVHELQASGDLVDVGSRLGLGQADLWLDGIEEIAASRVVLDHHVRGLGLVSGVMGSDDVRVL